MRRLHALLLVVLAPCAASAQSRFAVLEEPNGSAVGVSLLLNVGSISDPEAQAGQTYLAAHAVAAQIQERLMHLGASVQVSCDRNTIEFTLVAPRTRWLPAVELLTESVFDAEPRENIIEAVRADAVRTFAAEAESPVSAARDFAWRSFFGESNRWARPVCGTAERLRGVAAADVRALARSRFLQSRAVMTFTGPVRAAVARSLVERELGNLQLPLLVAAPQREPRQELEVRASDQATVTAWIEIVWPLARDVDEEATRLLGFALADAAGPSRSHPEVVDAHYSVERYGGGGALMLEIAVEPEAARRWIDRTITLTRQLGAAGLPADDLRALLKRYAGARLLALAAPEARASAAARALLFGGAYSPVAADVEGLDAARVRGAASALGVPTIAVSGPVELMRLQ